MSKFEITPQEKKLTRQLFYRSFALECSFNFEKMQALGFAWAMFPAIHEFCGTQEEQVEALKDVYKRQGRHSGFADPQLAGGNPPLRAAAEMRLRSRHAERTSGYAGCGGRL